MQKTYLSKCGPTIIFQSVKPPPKTGYISKCIVTKFSRYRQTFTQSKNYVLQHSFPQQKPAPPTTAQLHFETKVRIITTIANNRQLNI